MPEITVIHTSHEPTIPKLELLGEDTLMIFISNTTPHARTFGMKYGQCTVLPNLVLKLTVLF